MHSLAPLITDLAVILGVACLVTIFFQRIRQPVVLGYLLAGIIIGPYTPPHALVSDIPNIKILAELGMIFLMFSLGLEFSFHKLRKVGGSASLTGLLEVVLMVLVGLAVAKALHWSFYDALFLGAALAISSTTIIIKAFDELQLKKRRFVQIVFGVLIVEDLLAILLLVGLSTLVIEKQALSLPMLFALGKLVLVISAWVLVGYFFIPTFLNRMMTYVGEETLTICSIALCLLMVCIAAYFHYSPALGAFIMGSILAETPFVHRIETLVAPIRNIFGAVFFVAVGMLIDPRIILQHWPLVLLITAVTIAGKTLCTTFGALLTGQSVNNSVRMGFSMAQVGEFSFIIVGLGASLQVTNELLYPIIVAVSGLTTFTTPYLIRFSETYAGWLSKHLPSRVHYGLQHYHSWLVRAFQADGSDRAVLRKTLVWRLSVNVLVIAIVFGFVSYGVTPYLGQIIDPTSSYWELGNWLIAMLCAAPFLWGMYVSAKALLMAERHSGQRVMIAKIVSAFLVLAEILILSIVFFESWQLALPLGIVLLILTQKLYTYLDKSYRWFEGRLLTNMKNHHDKPVLQDLNLWDLHWQEFSVEHQGQLVGKKLEELRLRDTFQLNIVAIWRADHWLLTPKGSVVIEADDRLMLVGHDQQLENFKTCFAKKPAAKANELHKQFGVHFVCVTVDHPYLNKTIRASGIREHSGCLVVGLEREGVRYLNPDSLTELRVGDLLMLVGTM